MVYCTALYTRGCLLCAGNPLAILFTRLYGESVETSAMATYVLPRAARLLRPLDPDLAQSMEAYAGT